MARLGVRAIGPLVAVVLGALSFAAPAVAAKKKPDLIVTKAEVRGTFQKPPHIVLDPDGTSSAEIALTVKNIGKRRAPASTGSAGIFGSPGVEASDKESIEALDPGETDKVTLKNYSGLRPGFGRLIACADNDSSIDEAKEANNCLKRFEPSDRVRLAMIPRVWKVTRFTATGSLGGQGTVLTRSLEGMVYTYIGPAADGSNDDRFDYDAAGGIHSNASGTYGSCSMSGSSGDIYHFEWPAPSQFSISASLKRYWGDVRDPEPETYQVTFVCPGGTTFQTPASPAPLVTWVGPEQKPAMQPTSTALVGAGTFGDAAGETEYSWRFDADLPPLAP